MLADWLFTTVMKNKMIPTDLKSVGLFILV